MKETLPWKLFFLRSIKITGGSKGSSSSSLLLPVMDFCDLKCTLGKILRGNLSVVTFIGSDFLFA